MPERAQDIVTAGMWGVIPEGHPQAGSRGSGAAVCADRWAWASLHSHFLEWDALGRDKVRVAVSWFNPSQQPNPKQQFSSPGGGSVTMYLVRISEHWKKPKDLRNPKCLVETQINFRRETF